MLKVASLLLFRETGPEKELLFARPKGKDAYVFPGGKVESHETTLEGLQRELQEELNTTATDVEKIGTLTGLSPEGKDMMMHLHTGKLLDEPTANAEIEYLEWMSQSIIEKKRNQMTSMTLDHALPFMKEHDIF